MFLWATRLACAFMALGAAANVHAQEPARPQLALMGTVPIYWGEADGLAGMLDTTATGHWARPVLEREFELVPLDYLSAEALAPHRVLMLAQPRALSAEENVALDGWVRGGGRLLLFADPMMTGHSHYGLGDRRRPQDVALLSPILAHWGLDLLFDAEQPGGLRQIEGDGWSLPVNLAGQMQARDGGTCLFEAGGLLARCRLGEGEALVVADAALLDLEMPHMDSAKGLQDLLAAIIGKSGEIAGEPTSIPQSEPANSGVGAVLGHANRTPPSSQAP